MNDVTRPSNELSILNRLFMQALLALGEAGEPERACRLAAAGWTTLRRQHPREAERLNGTLHALTRTSHPTPNRTGDTHARGKTA
ncbi:MAG: hypothetical protein ACYDB9_10330 [Gammaproteobacteria bacterium]